MNNPEYIVVFVTVSSPDEARRIAEGLVGKKLAACVNIAGGIESVFRWEGKVDSAKELLLIIKTTGDLFDAVAGYVKSAHSYEVPEIIALPVVNGHKPYLSWIDESIGKP